MGTGVYKTQKKDGSVYYRISLTYKNKHISLGSSQDYTTAQDKYKLASKILRDNMYKITDYSITDRSLDYEKWIVLMNFRDNGLYFKTPIYLSKHYFTYYLSETIHFQFDVDDLFFYSTHKIFKRGNYYFVNDYGMQLNILSRYGIRNYASKGKDYLFIDGNPYNLRYENIQIVNPYIGVEKLTRNNMTVFKSKIHLNGYVTIGYFKSPHKAAIAYNKAVDFMIRYIAPGKKYSKNYIDAISSEEAEYYYTSIKLPEYLVKMVRF